MLIPQAYRNEWKALAADREGGIIERARRLSTKIALSFLDHCLYSDQYEPAYLRLLCEMATCTWEPEVARVASSSLFGVVIEGLCDEFEEHSAATYNRVMGQILSHCRKLPGCGR